MCANKALFKPKVSLFTILYKKKLFFFQLSFYRASNQRDLCVEFLRIFILKHLFSNLFNEKCEKNVKKGFSSEIVEDPLANEILNLPDKLTNVYQTDLR